MKKPPKIIEINNVTYAQASEFASSWRFLERLVTRNKVKKVTFGGVNYYDIDAVTRERQTAHTIPDGYVKATPYGAERGFTNTFMRTLCASRGAPAVQRRDGSARGRPAWYADKAWLDKKLGITVVEVAETAPKTAPKKKAQDVQAFVSNLAVLIERAETLVARLEGVLGTERHETSSFTTFAPEGVS